MEAIDYLGVKGARRLAPYLVAAKLWHIVEGGWTIHDYLEHNKPAAEVQRLQRERRKAAAKGGSAGREQDAKQLAEANGEAKNYDSLEQSAKQTLKPATATATEATSATATATKAEAATGRGTSLIAPRRMGAAFEGPRVYVPMKLHRDFLAFRNHPAAETELQEFYLRVSEAFHDGARQREETGSDMFKFWAARYDEQWPPTPVARQSESKLPEWARAALARKAAR